MTEAQLKAERCKRIVAAKLFMDRHFSEEIDLDAIGAKACFSKFHFMRLFKSMYGWSPHRYLTGVRINKARDHLRNGRGIAETCFAVGFTSVSSFSGLFKRITACTPAQYQKQAGAGRKQMQQAPMQFIPQCFAGQRGWAQKSNFEEAR